VPGPRAAAPRGPTEGVFIAPRTSDAVSDAPQSLEESHAFAYLERGLPVAALEALGGCRARASAAADTAALAHIENGLAAAYTALRQHRWAVHHLQAARALGAGGTVPLDSRLSTLSALTAALLHMGQLDQALDAAREAIPLAEAGGDAPALGRALTDLGSIHLARGEWEEAERASRRALALARASSDRAVAAQALCDLGSAACETGRLHLAQRRLRMALGYQRGRGPACTLARVHGEAARVAFRLGSTPEALHHGSAALEALWSEVGPLDKGEVAHICRLFGAVHHLAGEREAAVQCLNRAAAYYAQAGRVADYQAVSGELAALLAGAETGAPSGTCASLAPDDRDRVHFLTTLLALADDMSSTHPYLESHSEIVATYALALGHTLGLPDEDIEALGHAARLHDIGETVVDAGPLHPAVGAEMLRAFPLPEGCLLAVRHHHERWDGLGFPDGLAAEDIPLVARVLAVADAYATLTFDPAEPVPHSGALAVIRTRAGSAYDPTVVAAFTDLHEAA
jgi:putative nucleotidyltransferase with HDIG domain